MKRILVFLITGIFIFTVACSGEKDMESSDLSQPVVEGEDLHIKLEESWLKDLDTVNIKGQEVTDQIFADKDLTLVNIWATWCPACTVEMPFLQELSDHYEGTNVGIKGLLVEVTREGIIPGLSQEERDIAEAFLEEESIEYEQILVSEEMANSDIQSIMAYPTTFFVDSQGNFVGGPVEGARNAEGWMAEIEYRLEMLGHE